ncbi:aminotransferase class I/II-fold pyridoxal phosphate-dependent enzyme [Streptomyces niveus]|uniref:aminotransferase class I/II-fold pyridoxal phosphate-dependent enzyme n=1 Tax=Streptomyces niveus TaxID=193462 RepID=UPI00341F1BC3
MTAPLVPRPRHLRQGGDLTGLPHVALDLSLCANPYGPAPAAVAALRALDFAELVRPPYEAASRFLDACAKDLDVDADHLTAGRGVTEFITMTSQILAGERPHRGRRAVAVVVPEYSGTVAAFPYADLVGPPHGDPPSVKGRLALVHRAMETHRFVILSNPSNPEGLYADRDELLDIATGHPSSLLIVDEEYYRFHDGARSLAGADVDNIAVWTSIGKTYGLTGLRAGTMWTRNKSLAEQVRRYVPTWPLSQLDSVASVAALTDTAWRDDTLRRIRTDSYLSEVLLGQLFGASRVSGSVHFRFVTLDTPAPIAEHLESQGIATRMFDGTLPGHTCGIRFLAPTSPDQRDRLADAVSTCHPSILPR